MLTAKSIVVAAAAAFACAQAAAAGSTHMKISIHHAKDHTKCPAGEREVSVEGVEGVFCAKDQICAGVQGNCPGKQDGLPWGSRCDTVQTGVLGCVPNDEDHDDDDDSDDSEECGEGESPMSVEGVEGVFCVAGQACVADIKDGACPGKQDGLPYGSYCGKVKTGVYGCKPSAAPGLRSARHNKTHSKQAAPCKPGFSQVSVEGVPGVFCAKEKLCAGVWGNCPTESAPGLPYGAYCGEVKTGVLGCKPKTSWMAKKSFSKSINHKDHTKCPAGEREVSVEGVEGVFCAKDQICAGVQGNCPGKQDGLPWGSRCDTVQTGVLGCVPNDEDYDDDDDSDDSEECGEGESPMSVEGVEGVFCVAGQACVADIKDGACPGKQDGLPYGSYCGKVKTGVYGCKPSAAPGLRKKSVHKKH